MAESISTSGDKGRRHSRPPPPLPGNSESKLVFGDDIKSSPSPSPSPLSLPKGNQILSDVKPENLEHNVLINQSSLSSIEFNERPNMKRRSRGMSNSGVNLPSLPAGFAQNLILSSDSPKSNNSDKPKLPSLPSTPKSADAYPSKRPIMDLSMFSPPTESELQALRPTSAPPVKLTRAASMDKPKKKSESISSERREY